MTWLDVGLIFLGCSKSSPSFQTKKTLDYMGSSGGPPLLGTQKPKPTNHWFPSPICVCLLLRAPPPPVVFCGLTGTPKGKPPSLGVPLTKAHFDPLGYGSKFNHQRYRRFDSPIFPFTRVPMGVLTCDPHPTVAKGTKFREEEMRAVVVAINSKLKQGVKLSGRGVLFGWFA